MSKTTILSASCYFNVNYFPFFIDQDDDTNSGTIAANPSLPQMSNSTNILSIVEEEDTGRDHVSPTEQRILPSNDSEQQFDSHQQVPGGYKKKRTTFSSSQLDSLEIRFSEQKYLTKHDRSKLAATLGLTEKHIKTWYQNRRTKWKRECSDEVWSKERENAATAMYAQHLHLKSTDTTMHL